MVHHLDQPLSNIPTHSVELQLAVLTQQNKRLQEDILPFEIKYDQHQDELNILLNTAKQLKYHYYASEQQPLFSFLEKASQVSRTTFLAYIVEIYGAELTKGSVLFICDPLTIKYTSLKYDTYLIHYMAHYSNSLMEYGQRYNPWIDRAYFESPPSKFLNA